MARNKSRKLAGQNTPTAGPKSPVTLRLGDLEPEVEARAAGAALGSIVRRDLARYYRLMRNYKIHEGLGVDGADAVAHALRGFDDAAYEYIWAKVDELLSSRDLVVGELHMRGRFWRVDREALNLTLRTMRFGDYGRRMAILDAVERYWLKLAAGGVEPPLGMIGLPEGFDAEYPVTDPELDALVEVGLIGPGDAKQYRKKRDDPLRPPTAPPPTPAEEHLLDSPARFGLRKRPK